MSLWVSSEIFTSNNIFCLSDYTWPNSSVIQEHNLAPRAQTERTLSYISTFRLTRGGGISISFTQMRQPRPKEVNVISYYRELRFGKPSSSDPQPNILFPVMMVLPGFCSHKPAELDDSS